MKCWGLGLVCLVACGPGSRPLAPDADSHAHADAAPDALDVCHVTDDDNALGICTDHAPPNSFDPAIQWSWSGEGNEVWSTTTPLVAEMTDDNGDGEINMCDIPDVVVVAYAYAIGHIYVLDGQAGNVKLRFPTDVDSSVTPALGDIDHDGNVDVITADGQGHIIAFGNDGTVKWTSLVAWGQRHGGSIALADLDEDGNVEIIAGNQVFDHLGGLLWQAPEPAGNWSATTAANLDGLPGLEVVLGHAAYHADGSEYYVNHAVGPGYPQVANLDDDPEPEVLITNNEGLTVLEHDGTIKYADQRPTGTPIGGIGGTNWTRPAVIHDIDADGKPEFAMSSASAYTAYHPSSTIVWSASVLDESGIAGGTAFDFLGDGSAEAMYADERTMYVFDSTGATVFQIPRSSGTFSEYPVVADTDNDGSAEIVVVSNELSGVQTSPTVQVIRDRQDRWVSARRIWNEHTYHVTNVREDGTIPQHEIPSWTRLNTFRSNAQITNGGVCTPIL